MPALCRLQARTRNTTLRSAISLADRIVTAALHAVDLSNFDDPFGGGGATACAH